MSTREFCVRDFDACVTDFDGIACVWKEISNVICETVVTYNIFFFIGANINCELIFISREQDFL